MKKTIAVLTAIALTLLPVATASSAQAATAKTTTRIGDYCC